MKSALKNLFRYLCWIFSGLLLAMSFPNTGLPILGFVALIPAIYRSYVDGYISVTFGSFLFSIVFWIYTVDWFSSFHPLAPIGIMIPLYLYTMMPFVIFSAISKSSSENIILVFPFIWTAFEYLRGNGFWSLPLIYLAHTQYHFALTDNIVISTILGAIPSIAKLFGVFGVSFTVALFNSLILILALKITNKQLHLSTINVALTVIISLLISLFVFYLTDTITVPNTTNLLITIASFLIILTTTLLLKSSKERVKTLLTYYPIIIMLSSTLLGGYIFTDTISKYEKSKSYTVSFGLLQPNFSPWDKLLARDFEKLNEVLKLYKEASKNSDIVVGCESILRDPINYYYAFGESFGIKAMNISKEVGKPIILTYPHRESYLTNTIIIRNGQPIQIVSEITIYYNSALFFDKEGKPTVRYDKVHTVPFGEWTPFSEYIPPLRQAINAIVGGDITPGKEFIKVSVELKPSIIVNLGPIICFEDLYPYITKKLARMKVDVFINMTNDGWANSIKSQWQHLIGAMFRAIETGIPLIRATNTGKTAVILPYGKIISTIDDFQNGYMIGQVKITKIKTFFSVIGDYLFLVILLVTNLLILVEKIRKIY
ncbi:MAG: apolipoprotein N-acyltransferase [Brevinematales bacterium]|nr:apolipoprotein N-acyltransferase [Brevinematales bacterium]